MVDRLFLFYSILTRKPIDWQIFEIFEKYIHVIIEHGCPWSRLLKNLYLRLFVSFLFDEAKDWNTKTNWRVLGFWVKIPALALPGNLLLCVDTKVQKNYTNIFIRLMFDACVKTKSNLFLPEDNLQQKYRGKQWHYPNGLTTKWSKETSR